MTDARRKIIAFISGRLLSSKTSGSVYDFQTSSFTHVSGQVTDQRVSVYDHDRGCHLSGNHNGRQFSLYDFGDSSHINLEIEADGKFKGYDFGTSNHFSGTVRNNSISFYDFQTSQFYNYSI